MQQPTKPQQVVFLEDWLRSAATVTTANTNTNTNTTTTTTAIPPSSSSSSSSLKSGSSRSSSSSSASDIIQAWSDLRDPTIYSNPARLLSSLRTLSSHSPYSLHVADPQSKLLLSLLSSPNPLPPASLPLISRLLYAWLRKSPRPSPSLIQTLLLSALPRLLDPPSPSSFLLLCALAASPALTDPSSRSASLDLLLSLHLPFFTDDSLPEVLAGIGYALSASDDAHFLQILQILLGLRVSPSLCHGLMLLRLLEWLVSGFIHSRNLSRIETLCGAISETGRWPRFAALMAAAGVLRAFRLSSRVQPGPHLKSKVEGTIVSVAEHVISGGSDGDVTERRLLLQCIALGLVRCGQITSSGTVFLCLCSALLEEVFPLRTLFRMAFESPKADGVKEHLDSVLFKEAGAVTGVFCNQYLMADVGHKVVAETRIWEYSQALYFDLRRAVLMLRRKNDELIDNLDKIAEAAFLMVVVFAAEVAKHKLNSKLPEQLRPEAAVKILVAFACIEYLRRVRLPEYTEAVRRAVLTIQENAYACALFVESLPPYAELTNPRGSLALEGMRCSWWEDDVQTARVLFFLRVIPTCISLVPASMFGKLVASTMFLYMRHPNEKVARASHSVFVAFVSSGKDSEEDDRMALKEQLVFYYIQRSLEAYPGATPFEGLASGVAALVRHLPAGSPAIFYCIHSLVEKATYLCSTALDQDGTMWKTWEGNSEPCKKVLDLLLRLIALVDIQVLPYLLKQLAEFVVQLPKQGQNVLLDEMYAQVAESDDVARKPVLVSWLQSLSYLCSRKKTNCVKDGDARLDAAASLSASSGSLELSRTSARL